MASTTAAIIRKMRDLLLEQAEIRRFVGERVFVSASPDFPPDIAGFQPPAITVSPGDVSTARQNHHARAETVAVAITVYLAVLDEEELILGGNNSPGLTEMIDALDSLLDNSHEDGGLMESYFRVDKTGESKITLLESLGTAGYLGAKTITFEVEDYQAR